MADFLVSYQHLLRMGFDGADALKAAQTFPNDLNKAVHEILRIQRTEAPQQHSKAKRTVEGHPDESDEKKVL